MNKKLLKSELTILTCLWNIAVFIINYSSVRNFFFSSVALVIFNQKH